MLRRPRPQLFDETTRLLEYCAIRRGQALLQQYAAAIVEVTGADTLVELGSGTSEKTRLLLGALCDAERLQRYIPFDVDESQQVRLTRGVIQN